MNGWNDLNNQHQALAERFVDLAQTRGQLPVFAIEHGLDEPALEEMKRIVAQQIEADPHLASAEWSWNYLPLLVIATEVGYRYRGTGTDFWPVLSQDIGVEAGPVFRSCLTRLFELGHERFRLVGPGDSPWERHFPHISWPIGNSVVPLEIQPHISDALRHAVRAGVFADDTDRLLKYLRALAAGHSSRRFENWLLQSDVALEVLRRLLCPESEGWLSERFLARVDRDIRKNWSAVRAITEARRTAARTTARLTQLGASRYVLALMDGRPRYLAIRGPILSAHMRDEVIAALKIHGDRIRAVDGIHGISLRAFLAGGEIALKNTSPFPMSPLRRDDALDLDEGTAKATLERLQPLEPEFFAVEPSGLAACAVFPGEKLQPEAKILQIIRAREDKIFETRPLETSNPSDIEFLRRRGFVVVERVSTLQISGLPAPGTSNSFIDGFPLLVSGRGAAHTELLLDGAVASGDMLNIGGKDWKAIRPDVGHHVIEMAEGRELDRLEFEVVEPPDIEPAMVKMLPANANVSDLETGRLEIRVSAPLALEAVPIRIRLVSPNEPAIVAEGVIERLPARLTGRSPVLREIQSKLTGLRANETGLQLHVEPEGLLRKVFSLPPARRELRYDGETGQWISGDDGGGRIPSITATVAAPLLGADGDRNLGETRLVLPEAADQKALTAGLILTGAKSMRLGCGGGEKASLPALLREPTSSENGTGVIDVARAMVAWQLAGANDLLGNWERWSVVEKLEGALVEQFCGTSWRDLEAGIDPSIVSPHGALLHCAEALGLVSGEDLPNVESASDREFLRDRLIARLQQAVPDISEALLQWNEDLAGALDLAVIDSYEDLRRKLETNGIESFDEVDMYRPADSWRDALERSREFPMLPMFRPLILPEARWLALVRPFYSELTEDDLVDLLDSTHVDASRRTGLRWLGRSEIRTMLQLWLSPSAMLETEGWRELLCKGLSDVRTSRAVRYVALRYRLALGAMKHGSAV